jgi:hypothetical protein
MNPDKRKGTTMPFTQPLGQAGVHPPEDWEDEDEEPEF